MSFILSVSLQWAAAQHSLFVPTGYLRKYKQVFDMWLSVLCMRSKAWLAARVSLRLARMPRTASSAQ